MKDLIRAIAKLPGRRLRLLIRAGRAEARVQALEARLASVRAERESLAAKEARLERKLATAGHVVSALLEGAGSPFRGPGRPPKRRGPGRPPKRRAPGRPPMAGRRRRGSRPVNAKPLAQVLRAVLAKKRSGTVSELAAAARGHGYQTKSNPKVFAITVSLALRKRTDLFSRNGNQYGLAKGAASAN